MKLNILKTVYRALLTGMPIMTYNPLNLNTFNVPLTVEPFSTYLNFKLSVDQVSQISKYIKEYSSNLTLTPIKMFPGSLPEYIISVNIYNCTSPIFLNDEKKIVRCEINTYVKDEQNDKGTMIIDYLSNEISMDPLNIFKNKNNISFHKEDNYNYIKCISKNEKIKLDFWNTNHDGRSVTIGSKLIKYTDKVYYKNGIYDKVYYDSSLVNALTIEPYSYYGIFEYKGMKFNDLHSIFYFKDKLNFVGGMWYNLFDL